MLDFRRNAAPRDYFSRREQWRLLTLVMALGLAVFLMNEARKPERWRWLIPEPEAGRAGGKAGREARDSSQANGPTPASSPESSRPKKKRPVEVEMVPGVPAGEPRRPSSAEASSGPYFPGARPELLATVRDNTRFRRKEEGAWFHLLAAAKATDPRRLRAASIGRITRLQLSEQSAAYRGEVVTIAGVVRRVHWLAAPKNDYGIAGYYQTWIQPDDDPERPIMVYCLEWPEGAATGMNVAQPAVVTGFYFKRWLYAAKNGLEVAPVILARNVELGERRVWPAEEPRLTAWWAAVTVAVAALAAAMLVTYVYLRTRRGRRREPEPRP